MKTSKDKKIFLEALNENPFIVYAAKKAGISRSTVYRWLNNEKFKSEVDKILRMGKGNLVEIAIMMLTKKIKEGDMRAITYFLSHNDPNYIPIRTVYIPPPTANKTLEPGQLCASCGQKHPSDISPEKHQAILRAFKNFGLIEDENTLIEENNKK